MIEVPNPETLVAEFIRLLDVEDRGTDSYRGRRGVGMGVGRVFGGQVIAQALAAAERTIDDERAPHSLHAYFLRTGNEDLEIDYAIARDFDGRSFANRRVVASQNGKPILNLLASFHRREAGISHQVDMPDVPMPEALVSDDDVRRANPHLVPEDRREIMLRPKPLEIRPTNPLQWLGAGGVSESMALWIRATAPLPDDPRVHRAVLAYLSDMGLMVACMLPHGINWMENMLAGASLDHSLWFHGDFRADDWLLYVMDSPWSGNGRGFNQGRIYARDGRLVANVAQEAMIRVDLGE